MANKANDIIGQMTQDIVQELYDKWGVNKAMGQMVNPPPTWPPEHRMIIKPRSAGKSQWMSEQWKQAVLNSAYDDVSEAMREAFGDWTVAYPYTPPREAYAPVSCGHDGLKVVGV